MSEHLKTIAMNFRRQVIADVRKHAVVTLSEAEVLAFMGLSPVTPRNPEEPEAGSAAGSIIARLNDAYANGKLCREAASEIERLNASLQWEQERSGREGTHSALCWKWGPQHYECAMREIARQREVIETWHACDKAAPCSEPPS